MTTDFIVYGHARDTVFLLCPQTTEARQWAADHILGDESSVWSNIVVGHRYIGEIVRGIQDDGLTVKANLQ